MLSVKRCHLSEAATKRLPLHCLDSTPCSDASIGSAFLPSPNPSAAQTGGTSSTVAASRSHKLEGKQHQLSLRFYSQSQVPSPAAARLPSGHQEHVPVHRSLRSSLGVPSQLAVCSLLTYSLFASSTMLLNHCITLLAAGACCCELAL